MKHADHVNLLRPADLPQGGAWADFGAGSGAFTLALRQLVGPEAQLYAVDKDRARLQELLDAHRLRFGSTETTHMLQGDFSGTLDLPPLDGALMANSLHYFGDEGAHGKLAVLRRIVSYLKPGGSFLLVEYNVDSGNLWVPHPLSFLTWQRLALQAGLSEPRLLATHPSSFLREFYSALAYRNARAERD